MLNIFTKNKKRGFAHRASIGLSAFLISIFVFSGLIESFSTPKVAKAAYSGKSLRTVEFVLGGGAGIAVSQTGTDANNSNPRASDLNVYAGTAWNSTKGTAGRKTVQIPGTGIRVLSAYVDFTSQVTASAIVLDVELALDVGQGMASGTDYDLNAVIEDTGNAFIWRSTSGLTGMISAKADATMLFQHQSDANWNAGVSIVGEASVKGTALTWNMSTMKLVVTYEEDYSAIAHTALKTVRFPLRSTTAGDNGTKAIDCPVGTCSLTYTLDLPDLETTSDIMDAWFEVRYTDDAVATTTIGVNGGSAGVAHKALDAITDNHEHFIVYRPSIGAPNFATSTVGQLNVVVAGTAIGTLGGEVIITYKYNTSAPIQIETVRYFMGQQLAAPGAAASSTYNKTITVSNAGVVPDNIWFKYSVPTQGPLLFSATAKVGNSASTTFRATSTMSNITTGNATYIFDVGSATTSWSGSSSSFITSFAESDAAFDAPASVEAYMTFRWNGSSGGNVTKTGTFFAGNSPVAQGDSTFDTVFPYTVILPETVTKTLRSSYVRSAFTHSDATAVTSGTIIHRANASGPITYTQNLTATDIESYRSTIFVESTTTNFTVGASATRTNYPMVFSAQGSVAAEEYTFDNEHVVTYDANFSEEAAAPVQKSLRTVEFALGGGAGSAVSQTGTDANNSNPRASDLNVYAGTSWNSTRGTAGRKTVQIPGTGIRVLSAYVDFTTQMTSAANVTDIELALDVGQGMASGTDYDLNPVIANTGNAYIWNANSSVTGMISAKADATMLFQHQSDANWNAGVSILGEASVVGPTWNMSTMKLVITYEEDFSATPHTALKTIRYPLRSTTAGDSGTKNTDCTVGTCSFRYAMDLPDLATTSDIVDAWFEVSYVDDAVATTTIGINGGSAGVAHKALDAVNDNHEQFIIYRPPVGAPNLATTTVGQLDVVVAGTSVGALGGELVVTYKYNTGAPTQVETVRYFMGQQLTAPTGTASSTYNKTITVSNYGVIPNYVWYKYSAPIQNTLSFSASAKIGNSASTSEVWRPTNGATDATGVTTFILDMGNATTSWSGNSSSFITSFDQDSDTGDAPTSVEAFMTFQWSGSAGGNVTKTGKFFAGNSPVAHGDATFDTVFPYTIILPESVTKTLRSSYVRSAYAHSNAASITTGTLIHRANATGAITYTESNTDLDAYRGLLFVESTTTSLTVDAAISRTNYPMLFSAQGSITDNEYTFDNEHVVTYDANFSEITVVAVSGTIYTDEGITQLNSAGKVLRLRVGTSTPGFFSTTTYAGIGAWTISGVSGLAPGIPLHVWMDVDPTFRAFSFTKASTSANNLTGFNLYKDRVIIKQEITTGTSTSNAELGLYDGDDDTDIQFTANSNNLLSNSGQKLLVAYGTHYVPGGTVTTHSSSTALAPSGDFQLEQRNGTSSIITLGGTLTVAGSYYASSSSIMITNGYGVLFTASTTGKILIGDMTGDSAFASTTFAGTGGAWTYRDNASTTGNFTITAGTVTAPSARLSIGGNFTNNGTFTHNSGTTTIGTVSASLSDYFAGRDASGDSTGTGLISVDTIAISGNYAYVGKGGDATACSQTAGSAIGCEIMVFDISTPTSPTYVAGRDISGDSTGVGSGNVSRLVISGNYLYVAKQGNTTACSQVAGSAIGCELMVFDISTPTSPTYVAGRDASGDSTGVSGLTFWTVINSGNYIYLGKAAGASACSQVAGSADGCELMVFDVSTPTSPTYVAGRDSSGDSTGTTIVIIQEISISGNYAYVGKGGDATACSQTAGSAIGCELMVFDISTPTSPTYVAGRDAGGAAAGGEAVAINTIEASGNYVYVGKAGDNVIPQCSQVAGSAISCELMVFDVSTPTSPTYVAGRDTDGAAAGSEGGSSISGIDISGNYLYIAKSADGTACSQVAGSAIGCELMIFDISTPTSPTYVAGQDSSGASAGTGLVDLTDIQVSGNYQFVGKTSDATACSQTAGSAAGCELMVFGRFQSTLSGTLSVASALNNIEAIGQVRFVNNASTTNLIIQSGAGVTAPPLLSINGNYSNSGTFTAGSGTTTLSGTSRQTLSGIMIGASAFYNLQSINSSASTTFTASASTTNNFYVVTPNARIEFAAGVTTTLQNLIIAGTSGNEIYLYSGTPGSKANIHVPGVKSVSYGKVKDSDACSTSGGITPTDSIDDGNTLCWVFSSAPVINLLHYRWRIDHESEVSAGYYAAEDTALSNRTYKGDRMRLRTTLQNTGTGAATDYNYRLEYSSTSCSTWSNLGTSYEWFPDLTQYVLGYSSTTDSAGLSNPGGSTFKSGIFQAGSATTGPFTLPAAFFTEHEFTINTTALAQKNVTYCFRLTNSGSITNFTYTVQPQIILRGDAHPSSGGSNIEVSGVGPAVGGGGQGGGGGSEGSGGGGGRGGGGQGGGGGDSG